MTASISVGLRAALGNPKLVCLIWAWYGLLALVPVLPAWAWWNAALGPSPEAASVLGRFDLGVFLDLTRSEGVGGLGLLRSAMAVAAAIAVVSSTFVFGGMLEVLGSGDDRRPLLHRFFRGGGHFFGRFLRLALIAGVCLVVAVGAVSAFQAGMNALARDSEWEPAGYLAALASIVVFLAAAGLFLLALDYARIRVARDDSRRMLKAYASGLGFVLRRIVTAYGIALVIIVFAAALSVGYLAYETNAPAAGTWGAIAVLVLIQQAVVLGRVFLRVALVGAERHFYGTAVPVPAAAAAAVPAAPEIPAQGAADRPAEDQVPG